MRDSAGPPDGQRIPVFSRTDYLLALFSALLAFALYLRTLAPGLLGGDSGELQFAAWLGGAAHPTGYPLYLMLGWLWTHLLPARDPAWRMNAFSALWGAMAVGLVYLLAARVLHPVRKVNAKAQRRKGSVLLRRLPALVAALTFAVTPTFWSQGTIAEVYTLNAVFVVAILLAAVIWGQTGSRGALYAAALLVGLSLAHHRTTLLYLPAILIYIGLVVRATQTNTNTKTQGRKDAVSHQLDMPDAASKHMKEPIAGSHLDWPKGRALSETDRRIEESGPSGQSALSASRYSGRISLRTTAVLCLLVCLPLLLYLYLPLRAPHTPYNRVQVGPDQTLEFYRPTWRGFVEHISGQGFGSALGAGKTATPRLSGLPTLFAGELTAIGVGLGLLGLAWLVLRQRPLLALTALSWLAVVGFNLLYGIGDIYVYYIPAYLIWTIWMAAGLGAICDTVKGRHGGRVASLGNTANGQAQDSPHPRVPASPRLVLVSVLCLVSFALPIYLLVAHLPALDRSKDQTAQAWAALLAQPIPQDAILVTNDRDEMVPQWYLKYVEGRRADLTGLFPLIQPGPAWADVGAVTHQALRSGRPVYLIKPMPGIEVRFDLGPLVSEGAGPETAPVRVFGPAATSDPAQAHAAMYGDVLRLSGYDLRPAALQPGAAAEITLYWQPVGRLDADYTTFVHLLDGAGARIAQSDHKPGGIYYPTSLWKPGETLIDRHTLSLPASPGPSPYSIVVGIYENAGELRHLGEPRSVGGWPGTS